jgi:predicted DNA-binding transcriptional regulator AlpA
MTAEQLDVLLDVRQVAVVCGCSTRHISRLAKTGQFPAPVRLGKLVRWTRKSIDKWLSDGCPSDTGSLSREPLQ